MVSPLLGQYVAGDSPLHRISAGAKLALMLVLTVAVSLSSSIPYHIMALSALVGITLLSGRATRPIFRSLFAAGSLILFTLVLYQLFPGTAEGERVSLFGIMLNKEALFAGVRGALRILVMFLASMLLFATTDPVRLVSAFTRGLSPLARLGFPVTRLGITLFIALRFLPVMQAELAQISEAQQARGIRHGKSLSDRVRRYRSLLGPALAGSLRRADELADALVVRGFQLSVQPCSYGREERVAWSWGIGLGGTALLVALAFLL